MRVEREVLAAALALAEEEGHVLVEAKPRAGLTLFLAQVGSRLAAGCAGSLVYVNAAASSGPIVPQIGEKVGCSWSCSMSAQHFLRDLAPSAPLVLLIDGAEHLTLAERGQLEALCQALRSERLFVPALASVYVVMGAREPWACSKLHLGYFTLREVALLLKKPERDRVSLALYAWTGGAPELVREAALALECRESDVGAVYQVVREMAEHGRLKRVAAGKPSLAELRRLGLAGERVVPAMRLAQKMTQSLGSGLVINRSLMEVRYRGRLLALFPQEMRILFVLAEHPGRVFTPSQIYSLITGGQGLYGGENSVKAQVSRLRQKLPPPTPWILTKRGLGYAFNTQATYSLI
ncbi:MAG: Heme response regulator HssR [Firmicutes bacterium]|nr:Heme response regulator HssR [Bacillota bacterium]